jgi:hypothetical protein
LARFQELDSDQRREAINTQQRYAAYCEAAEHANAYRGSMVWTRIKGRNYLVRSYYDTSGVRRQISLGLSSKNTEAIKLNYKRDREDAQKRLKSLKAIIVRQSAINRAIGLGRVPLIGAKIVRALDQATMLDSGIRVLGTNAIFAYEAVAGVHVDPGLASNEDVDGLFDSRSGLILASNANVSPLSLLRLLKKIDHSFKRSSHKFRAVNAGGYFVDLIKPSRNSRQRDGRLQLSADADEYFATETAMLNWFDAPSFDAIAIDEKGEPLRIVATDPRVWVAHSLWLSKRKDRKPFERRRDREMAHTIGRLVVEYMPHLQFASDQLQMLPKSLFKDAAHLFRR